MVVAAAAVTLLVTACAPEPPSEEERSAAPPDSPPVPARTRDLESAEDLPESYRPHPDFALTMGDVRELLSDQRPIIREAILSEPAVFLEYASQLLAQEQVVLALVDKGTRLSADYVPEDLVPLQEYGDRLILNREGLSLRAAIMPDLLAMVEAARQAGIQLDISSTYRSYGYQRDLFDYWVAELGQAEAERVSARPGTSQHQLGTTVDFGSITPEFAAHPAGVWLAEHASTFGFSLSYPEGYEEVTGYSYEPWHFRWISRSGTDMERHFFDGIQQHALEFWSEAEPVLRDACTCGSRRDTVTP
jgi:D-alanyl-D-alanine carboxypeptidase